MRGIRLLVVFVVGLAACDHSPQEREAVFCDTFCNCKAAPTPSAQEQCVEGCAGDINGLGNQISDACLNCITGHADRCATLELECEQLCNSGGDDNPPPPVEFPDGGVPMGVDAF